MSSTEPGPSGTATELSRELLRQAYPDQPETWINEHAEQAARHIKAAAPRQFQASKNAASSRRRRPDARRGIIRWGITVAALLGVGAVVVVQREAITAALAREGGLFTVAVIALLALGMTVWMRIRERYEKVPPAGSE